MIAHIEAQGSLLRMVIRGKQPGQSFGGAKRGIIRAFSRSSRLRLMRFLARLKTRKIRATFITLTFTGMVHHDFAKRALKRFAMRLRRKFELLSAVWRLEYQPKRGAIHFHLLCFNMPFWKQKELQKTWEACTGEKMSIADIRLLHGARSIMGYISKYIAKVDDRPTTSLDDGSYQHAERESSAGRFWGYINKELLPLGEVVAGVLTDRQTIRSLSSFAWSLLGSDNPYNSLSFHLFCDNARWLCERAIEEGGVIYDEWEYTTTDHTRHKSTAHPFTSRFSEAELSTISVQSLGREYRPSEASSSQPIARGWVARSSRAVPASREFPYFDEYGKVVTSSQSKEVSHGIV